MTSVDRYELVEKIATGGMADVFVALQRGGTSFVRSVVVKRLHRHLSEQPEACAAFESEGRILALLDHPAIPHALDYGMSGDTPFLVMQHLDGPTLKRACDAGPIPLEVGVSVGIALADALDHAHNRCDPYGRAVELVHQDLTPSNVVLRPCGRVGLLDFGIATTARDRRGGPLSGVRGTTGYMAPEQFARRHEVDRRTDVFLLGVLLWELTLGRPLFPADDLAFFEAITRAEIPKPSSVSARYPRTLESILMRALSREPEPRHGSARELGEALLDFASSSALEVGEASLRSYVAAHFANESTSRYLPATEEHGAGEVPELTLEDELTLDASGTSGSLSDVERRELLDELELFAAQLDTSEQSECEPAQDRSAVLGKRPTRPRTLPVPPLPRAGRGGLAGVSDEDSGVYMQLEPGASDQVFTDD